MSKINPVEWIAFAQGRWTWDEVKHGRSRKINPYPEGSTPWDSWNRGWFSMVEEAQHDKQQG